MLNSLNFFLNKMAQRKLTQCKLTEFVVRSEPLVALNKHTLFFDGCSKGNPGSAGAGAVLYLDKEEIWATAAFVGAKETNNVAEYTGLVLGLAEATNRGIQHLVVKGDSKLVIEQMKGKYQVKAPNLMPLYQQAKQYSATFITIDFIHVYRNENKRADELSNQGLVIEK
jgi:ribonuclease HI